MMKNKAGFEGQKVTLKYDTVSKWMFKEGDSDSGIFSQ